MPTKKEVEQIFKSRGFELLESYLNTRQKLKYRCVCGNISYKTIQNLRIGQFCKECEKINYRK